MVDGPLFFYCGTAPAIRLAEQQSQEKQDDDNWVSGHAEIVSGTRAVCTARWWLLRDG